MPGKAIGPLSPLPRKRRLSDPRMWIGTSKVDRPPAIRKQFDRETHRLVRGRFT